MMVKGKVIGVKDYFIKYASNKNFDKLNDGGNILQPKKDNIAEKDSIFDSVNKSKKDNPTVETMRYPSDDGGVEVGTDGKFKFPENDNPTVETMRYPSDDGGVEIGTDGKFKFPENDNPTVKTMRYPSDDGGVEIGTDGKFKFPDGTKPEIKTMMYPSDDAGLIE